MSDDNDIAYYPRAAMHAAYAHGWRDAIEAAAGVLQERADSNENLAKLGYPSHLTNRFIDRATDFAGMARIIRSLSASASAEHKPAGGEEGE